MPEYPFVVEQSCPDSPQFLIVHRFWRGAEGDCLPGEEVAAILAQYNGCMRQLRLSLALRLLFDHLGRHRWIGQNAAQIEASMRASAFYVRHAANSNTSKKLTRRMNRSTIKVYVARIREALQLAFDEVGIRVQPTDILVSERSVGGGEVTYRLRAKVRWVHLP
jgi:hypothetical protein